MTEYSWHNLSSEKVVQIFKTDIREGLSEKEAKERQGKFGPNKLPEDKPLSHAKIFFEQFRSPLIYILVIAGVVTLTLGDYTDSVVIFGAVVLNTIVGFFQENKASRALGELKRMVKVRAQVIREGNRKIIDSSKLVPGDIFILGPGDKVPADGRIIEPYELKINEMALTGEWLAAEKKRDVLPEKTPLADRDNMVYMGTVVEDGTAKVLVTETGLKTEMGKVAVMLKETKEEKTPLQKKLGHFAGIIGGIIVIVCIFIFIEGIITGNTFLEMFTTSVAVAVAAIPEGLPVALTVILALGMQRILKRKGLVRKLLAAETLGSTSVIATDKTATLTEGKMMVTEILTYPQIFATGREVKKENSERLLVLKIITICNEAFIENPEETMEKWIIRGRPTDRALLLAGMEAGFNKKELEQKMTKIAEVPFNPINKFLARAFEINPIRDSESKEKTGTEPISNGVNNKEDILYVSGAAEKILEMSKYIMKNHNKELLTPQAKKKIELELENLAQKGLRVVGVAEKEIDNLNNLLDNLIFVGLVSLKDPLRKKVKKAIEICRQAGMRPIIVTGDHVLTAKAVAEELGFKLKKENIIEGKELDKMENEEFLEKLESIQIYARVEPKHKMRIIQAWQEKGEVVAMTGDGINDAPALKKADIGVALGSGTDVAKEVSDLILLPDSFSIIVAAVEEGRAIIDNIRKVITYLFCSAFTEVLLVGTAIFIGWPLPILAAQILWINLIEDGPLSLALAFEPKDKDLMRQKPAGHIIPLFTKEMKVLVFIVGVITDFLLLGIFYYLLKFSNYDIYHIRSIIFAGLAVDSIFYIFACKSLRKNIWQINPFSNRFLIFAWIFGVVVLLLGLYLPPLQILLKTEPLNLFDWQLILTLGIINLILIELTKFYFIKKEYV